MKFACYIFNGRYPSRLYGPFDDIEEAVEAGMMASAGSPEDPVDQGGWSESHSTIIGQPSKRVLVSDSRGVPVFMAMTLESGNQIL